VLNNLLHSVDETSHRLQVVIAQAEHHLDSCYVIYAVCLFVYRVLWQWYAGCLIDMSIFAEFPMVVSQSYNSLAGAYVRGPDL
jgi:hypothetical protein